MSFLAESPSCASASLRCHVLNSALLPGLVLLAGLPLLIHLLNLQFPRLFEFSSVKHIRETIAQRSRLFRWRHLLLLLLRTLFLILLLLAFLKPLIPRFGSAADKQAGRAVAAHPRSFAEHGAQRRRREQPTTRGE